MNFQVRRGMLNAILASAIPMIGIGVTTVVFADESEIDVFDQALASGSKDGAVRFLEAFPSSHLGGDLIELLPPDVAAEVCASLPSGTRSSTRRLCGQLSETVAQAPAAGGSESGDAVAQGPNAQPTGGSPVARELEGDMSKDAPRWLTQGPPETTNQSANSRRDGLAASDTTDNANDDAPDDTTDTPSTTDNPPDTEAAPTETETITGRLGEDGGSVASGPGGRGSDSSTGGNSGAGGADGGGRR